jgi:hypothetical protein
MAVASETGNQMVKYLAQVPPENESILHNIALRLSNLSHFNEDYMSHGTDRGYLLLFMSEYFHEMVEVKFPGVIVPGSTKKPTFIRAEHNNTMDALIRSWKPIKYAGSASKTANIRASMKVFPTSKSLLTF